MVRRIWMVAVVIVSSSGCERGAGNTPAGSADPASTTATPKGTAEQTTTNPPPDENTREGSLPLHRNSSV